MPYVELEYHLMVVTNLFLAKRLHAADGEPLGQRTKVAERTSRQSITVANPYPRLEPLEPETRWPGGTSAEHMERHEMMSRSQGCWKERHQRMLGTGAGCSWRYCYQNVNVQEA